MDRHEPKQNPPHIYSRPTDTKFNQNPFSIIGDKTCSRTVRPLHYAFIPCISCDKPFFLADSYCVKGYVNRLQQKTSLFFSVYTVRRLFHKGGTLLHPAALMSLVYSTDEERQGTECRVTFPLGPPQLLTSQTGLTFNETKTKSTDHRSKCNSTIITFHMAVRDFNKNGCQSNYQIRERQ